MPSEIIKLFIKGEAKYEICEAPKEGYKLLDTLTTELNWSEEKILDRYNMTKDNIVEKDGLNYYLAR
ncbi:MAG: hypothetical protein ABEJ02_03705 [Candidatus Paceibacteria bacterium]